MSSKTVKAVVAAFESVATYRNRTGEATFATSGVARMLEELLEQYL